jgi:hypothetical protein
MRSFFFLALFLTVSIARGFPEYYNIGDHDKAQAEACQRHLALAWVGGFPEDLTRGYLTMGSQAELEQLVMATLYGNVVIIFFDGRNMAPVPDLVHAQFHIQDDGPLSNGASWVTPKVVFTNPEVTQILGRVSATDLKAKREVALNSALQIIRNNPAALAAPEIPVPTATAPQKSDASSVGSPPSDFLSQYGVYCLIIAVGSVGLIFWIVSARRSS